MAEATVSAMAEACTARLINATCENVEFNTVAMERDAAKAEIRNLRACVARFSEEKVRWGSVHHPPPPVRTRSHCAHPFSVPVLALAHLRSLSATTLRPQRQRCCRRVWRSWRRSCTRRRRVLTQLRSAWLSWHSSWRWHSRRWRVPRKRRHRARTVLRVRWPTSRCETCAVLRVCAGDRCPCGMLALLVVVSRLPPAPWSTHHHRRKLRRLTLVRRRRLMLWLAVARSWWLRQGRWRRAPHGLRYVQQRPRAVLLVRLPWARLTTCVAWRW